MSCNQYIFNPLNPLNNVPESHGESEQSAGVGDEADEGDLLVALDARHDGVADVHVDQRQVPTRVHEQLLADLAGWFVIQRCHEHISRVCPAHFKLPSDCD